MEEALDRVASSIEELQKKFYGVATGEVLNVLDPMTLGRVQVRVSFVDDADLTAWARVSVPMAGLAHGTYFIPNPGDSVLVAFEHGNLNAPYVIGSVWSAKAPPPFPSPLPQVRTIKTPLGHEIIFADSLLTLTIKTPGKEIITLAPTGVTIAAGSTIVSLTEAGVTITGKNINLIGTTAINLNAPTINVNGSTATNVQSGGSCKLTAPTVAIN